MAQSTVYKPAKPIDKHLDSKLIEKAYSFAVECHKTQKRHSGDPYISHPVAVADILLNLKLDTSTIITGLLHDTLEDTLATENEIEEKFGKEILQLVNGVTKLSKIETYTENKFQAENFRKLILAMSKDIRVLLVKLADRLHNMRTIQFIPQEKRRQRIASETLEIYAPLAGRLGMHEFKDELEDLSFQILNPSAYSSLMTRIEYLKKDKSNLTDKIKTRIFSLLEKNEINCQIIGREKKIFSVWNKMQNKQIAFRQLSDIFAYRIITESIEDCYSTLGIIHNRWSAVPGSFKDYISTPKINNYQSIHTTIVGPERQRVELQIRTNEMNTIADKGIAAHWSYKENYNLVDNSSSDPVNVTWLRDLVEILDSGGSSEDLLEATKLEMFQDQVFCFTPKGDLIHLPANSNSIDFAYALHSEIGNRCVGCKINGKPRPLFTKLQNGDEIEVLTSKKPSPSETWENIVTTAKAQSSIKRFFKKQEKDEFTSLGLKILHKVTGRNEDISNTEISNFAKSFNRKSPEEFLVAIGKGSIKPHQLSKLKPRSTLSFFSRYRRRDTNDKMPLEISNFQPGIAIHYAECCFPLPNENILGLTSEDSGVIIHSSLCKELDKETKKEDWITASWKDVDPKQYFSSRIKVSVKNEPGSLGKLATIVGSAGGNITNLNISEKGDDYFDMIFIIDVHNLDHLDKIIETLSEVDIVSSVSRLLINL